MVRIKNRWLLLTVCTYSNSNPSNPQSQPQPLDSTQIEPHSGLDSGSLTRLIRNALALNFGDAGAGALGGLICKYYARTTGTAILRCSREGLQVVRATIFMIDEALGKRTRILVEHCGGTIKKVQQRAIQLDRRKINLLFKKKRLTKRQQQQASDSPLSSTPTSKSALASLGLEDLGTSMETKSVPQLQGTGNDIQRKEGSVETGKRERKSQLEEEEEKLLEEIRAGILSIS